MGTFASSSGPAREASERRPRRTRDASRLLLVAVVLWAGWWGVAALDPSSGGPAGGHPQQHGAGEPGVVPNVQADPWDGPGERLTSRLRSVSTAPSRPRVSPVGSAVSTSSPGVTPPPAGRQRAAVKALRPVLRLDGVGPEALQAVLADPGVEFATTVHLGALRVRGGATATVGLVEPGGFRVLAPQVTADADAVWDALERGEALVSPDRIAALGARRGEPLALADGAVLPVGGSASNGAPPLVDVIAATGAGLDVGPTRRSLLVAARGGVDIPALAARLEAAAGVAPEAMPAAEPAIASLVGDHDDTVAAFEPFTYRDAGGGRIAIDGAWVERNIVRAEVPVLGVVTCHRLLVPQLKAALQQVVDAGLADLLDAADYGGCYVPRHIDWTSSAALSMHAWGIAVDVNVATNGLGREPQLDRRVVEIFEAHGFSWGGRWRRPDGMHFELGRLLTPGQLAGLSGAR